MDGFSELVGALVYVVTTRDQYAGRLVAAHPDRLVLRDVGRFVPAEKDCRTFNPSLPPGMIAQEQMPGIAVLMLRHVIAVSEKTNKRGSV